MLIRSLLFILSLATGFSAQAMEWLIDVRTADEYIARHADGAANIEYQQIVMGVRQLGVNKQDTIHLYCRSGRRADIAREALLHAGYINVENLGTLAQAEAWRQQAR